MSTTPNILIVDDEKGFCAALVKRLTVRQMFAVAVHNGRQALRQIALNSYDVVLLDIKLPDMDGIDVLRQLKEKSPRVQVIMLSGHASVDIALEALKHGAYDYIFKPCDFSDLWAKVISAHEQQLENEKFV